MMLRTQCKKKRKKERKEKPLAMQCFGKSRKKMSWAAPCPPSLPPRGGLSSSSSKTDRAVSMVGRHSSKGGVNHWRHRRSGGADEDMRRSWPTKR